MFYVDFIIVVILCFMILEFFFVLCKEEIVSVFVVREGKILDVLKVIYSFLLV